VKRSETSRWQNSTHHVQELRFNSNPKSVPRYRVDGFTVVDWREFLLRTNDVPAELLEKCPWDKFTGFDWAGLLFGKKKLGRYCPWKTFDKDDWRILLFFHPEYRKEFEVHSGLKDEDLHVEDPGPIGWL